MNLVRKEERRGPRTWPKGTNRDISYCERRPRVLLLPVEATTRQEIQPLRVPDITPPVPVTVTTHTAPASISPQEILGTAKRLTLIAEGGLDSGVASQLLNETFNSPDYLQVLRDYPAQQQFIDGLYEAYSSFCFVNSTLT